jgi:hypothetical protein
MILKGRCRGHGSQLARYLFHEKNDSIAVLDLRGTCAHDLNRNGLIDAMKEFDEYGKLTQGEKTIFHLAIAPSDYDRMDSGKWKYAVAKAEEALGLEGQPRAVVMHTYEGKDHLHVAWSRVDLEKHTLKSDSFTNLKLCNAARDIELELGLSKLPDIHRGHERAKHLNEEFKQHDGGELKERSKQSKPPELTPFPKPAFADELARKIERSDIRRILPKPKYADNLEKKIAIADDRAKKRNEKQREKEVRQFAEEKGNHSQRELERTISTAWHRSDDGAEFKNELAKTGYRLVRGDRGAVVMDAEGNVYSPARYIEDAKAKDVNKKCADILEDLQTVDAARNHAKDTILSPRKAGKLVRTKLRLEMSNDPKRPPRVVNETEEYEP